MTGSINDKGALVLCGAFVILAIGLSLASPFLMTLGLCIGLVGVRVLVSVGRDEDDEF